MTRNHLTHTKRHTLKRSARLTSYLALPLIFGLFFVPMIGAEAAPITWEVSSDGDANCTNNKCDKIVTALGKAAASGDTIKITKDIHTERDITVDKSVTIQGRDTGSTVIQACEDAVCPAIENGSVFIIGDEKTVTIKNLTITKGNTTGNGGAILNEKGTLTVINSTIGGNTAVKGGGISSGNSGGGGATTLENCTITNNIATNSGGGIYAQKQTITFKNSIIAGNQVGNDYDNCRVFNKGTGSIVSDGYNLIGVACYKDLNNISLVDGKVSDQFLGEYDFNDLFAKPYSTLTNGVYPLNDDPADPTGPTAIDQIDKGTSGCGDAGDKDQLGVPRPKPENGLCDIGAVEYKAPLKIETNVGITVNEDQGENTENKILNTELKASDSVNDSSSIEFTVTSDSSHGTLSQTSFTQAYIDAGTLTYTHDGNEEANGSIANDTFNFTVTNSLSESITGTFNITVTPVNDPPVNTAPTNPTTDPNTDLTLNVSIKDDDAGINDLKVTLTTTKGILTLNGTENLNDPDDDTDGTDGGMDFTGELGEINKALNGMIFKPETDYYGPASVSITTNDQDAGNPLSSGTDTINITVNDTFSPTLTKEVPADSIDQDAGTFFFRAHMNEPGKVYYVLLNEGVSAPTVDAIKTESFLIVDGSVNDEQTQVTGFVSGKPFYVLGVDDAGNPHLDSPELLTIDTKVTLTINRLGAGSGSVTGNGINCGIAGTICILEYDKGTNISLSATAASSSYFVEWAPAECANPFTIQNDMSCSATFNAGDPPPPPPPPVDPLPPEMTFKVTINGIGSGDISFTPRPVEENCNSDETQCDYIFKTAEFIAITVTPEEGSFFNGWAEENKGECPISKAVETEEGGSKIERIFMTENKHCVISLKLNPKNLTLTTTGEGSGSATTNPTGTPCDIGDNCITFDGGLEVTLIPEPAPDSVFNSWLGNEDCSDGKVTMMINKTCTAQFDLKPKKTLTLILEGADGKLGSTNTTTGEVTPECSSPCTIEHYEGAPITLNGYADEPDDFYIDEWKGDGCTEGKVTLDSDKTCTGHFGPRPTFNLTLQIIGEGRVERTPSERAACDEGNCFSYLSGTTVTLQFFLSGDSQDYQLGDNCSNRQMVMDSNQTCTVTFTKEVMTPPPDDGSTYKLSVALGGTGTGSVTSEPAGIDCGINCSANYPKDVPVTLIATPADDGSQFDGWSEGCLDGKVTAGHNSVISCIARFRLIPTYLLTVKKSGSGSGTIISEPAGIIDCDGNCLETAYKSNTPIEVALFTKPSPGSVFKGWIGDCRQEGSVTLDSNKVCTAIFDGFGTLQFSSTTPTVEINEDRGALSLTVNRIKGSSGEVSVKYATANGTAKAGADYTTSTGILTWQTGKSEAQTITIPINLDKEEEENETFSLTLSEPTDGSVLGTNHKLDITIIHVPWFGSVQFVMPSYSVNESDGIAKLLVTRAGSRQSSLTVDYSTEDNSATANSDYTPISNTLTWADGDKKPKTIEIPVLYDNLAEENETFVVKLVNVTGDAQLGTNQKATVTIVNTPGAGNLEFSAAEYSVEESQLQIKILVKRVGGRNGAVSVLYASHDGSAGAGQDYSAVNGTLNWLSEDAETKEIIVPIIADQLGEEEENFTLNLSEATGGATLGAIATATVKIINTDNSDIDTSPTDPDDPDDPDNPDNGVSALAGILQLGAINYQVDEGNDSIEITVSRTQGNQGTAAINYATQNETALADQDYQTTNGKLQWADGDTEDKHFSVNIIDDNIVEESERFKVTLSEPEGAEVGDNVQAAIEINDDDTSISLDSNTYQTDGSSSVLVTIRRHGNSSELISVDYTTNDGTAKADKDYIATAGTLKWSRGQDYDQTVMIPLIPSSEVNDKAKQFTFNLTNVSDKATLGIPSEATVIISTNLCDEVGQSIACTVIANDEDAPLSNVEIAQNGLVVGATLSGDIKNHGALRDITLLPDTQVKGGTISGKVSGDPENPARLSNVYITADATVQNVIIADGSTVDPRAKLGKGVLFEDNSSIPKNVELGDLLGRKPKAIFGRKAANLSKDMLYNGAVDGILGAINSLPALTISGFTLTQDAESGALILDIGNLRIAVLPTQVKQSTVKKVTQDMPMGLYITPNHQVTFITHTAREIITQPVMQAPAFFNEELRRFNLNEPTMSENGNIQIVINEGASIMARAAAFALQVQIPLGISTLATPVANTVNVSFVFEDKEGNRRQQLIYPAAADPEALFALSPNETDIVLEYDGRAHMQFGGNLYEGLLDYVVTTGNPPTTATTQILDIGDINADGCNDYRINYPKGESQILYCQ